MFGKKDGSIWGLQPTFENELKEQFKDLELNDNDIQVLDHLYVQPFENKKYESKYAYVAAGNLDKNDYEYKNKTTIEKQILKHKFIPISSVKARKINRNYRASYDKLLNYNLIECDNNFKIGEYYNGYRINPVIRESKDVKWKAVQITNRTLLRNLKRNKEEMWLKAPQYLKDYYNKCLLNIYIDDPEALRQEILNLNEADIEPGKNLEHVKSCALYNLEKIINQDYYFVIDEKSGRVFTNVTNVPKFFRKHLVDQHGNHFTEIDLSNSQLLMLCILMFNNNRPIDAEFSKNVLSGTLYNYLAEVMNKDRDWVKHNVLVMFFLEQWRINRQKIEIARWFRHEFPFVFDFIKEFKTVMGRKGHIDFAITLQKMESDMMIGTILPQLLKYDFTFFSVHDSFCVPESYMELTKNIILKEFKKKHNITPAIKIKKMEVKETASAVASRACTLHSKSFQVGLGALNQNKTQTNNKTNILHSYPCTLNTSRSYLNNVKGISSSKYRYRTGNNKFIIGNTEGNLQIRKRTNRLDIINNNTRLQL